MYSLEPHGSRGQRIRAPTVLRRRRDGIEGLPLQLIIALAIVAAVLPVAYSSLQSFENSKAMSGLQAARDRLVDYANLAYASPGSRLCLDVSVPTTTFRANGFVRIGDASGPTRETAAFGFPREAEFMRHLGFPSNASGGGALILAGRDASYHVCAYRPLSNGKALEFVTTVVV
jgi:hypothetical protein